MTFPVDLVQLAGFQSETTRTAKNYVNRGEMVLNRAVSQRKLTDSGAKAFIAAIDPFHDRPIDMHQGWPDLNTEPSVVRHWKDSYTIACGEDGGAILVHSYPILNFAEQGFCSRRSSVIDTIGGIHDVSTSHQLAPVNIYRYTAVQAGNDNCPLIASTSPLVYSSSVPEEWFRDGPCRLVGLGVEIRDVTAEIYKQGTLTVYEQPQSIDERSQMVVRAQTVGGVAYIQTPVNTVPFLRPPQGLAEMLLQPTTRQWDAKQGCYFVMAIGENNEPRYADYISPALYNSTQEVDSPDMLNTQPIFLGPYADGSVNGDNFIFLPNIVGPFDSKGVYLTGLNANSTFTITVSYWMETFPVCKSSLYPLATKSACYDPVALKMISEASKSLPIGVPVDMNPLGEWFWDVVSAVAPILGVGAGLLFPPAAPYLAAGGAALGEMASRQVNREEKKNLKKEIRKDNKQMIDAEIRSMRAQNPRSKVKTKTNKPKVKTTGKKKR